MTRRCRALEASVRLLITDMNEARNQLKNLLVPRLKSLGFNGSFPHFRRVRNLRNELLTIQFDKYGTGRFVIELASAPTGAFITYWGKEISESKLTAHDLSERFRLGSSLGKDSWFSIDTDPNNTIEMVVKLLDSQGQAYFDQYA